MILNVIELKNINIAFVYEELDKDLVSRDRLRSIFINDEKPQITDFPNILIVNYKQIGLNVLFEEKRIIISLPVKENNSTAFELLSSLGRSIYEAVENPNVAFYGFNYQGTAKVEPDLVPIGAFFKDKFLKEQTQLEDTFQGEIYKVFPKFSLKRQECEFYIALEPTQQNDEFSFHLNVHFETGNIPTVEQFNESIATKYDLFRHLLETI
jgi:hypothetical protein